MAYLQNMRDSMRNSLPSQLFTPKPSRWSTLAFSDVAFPLALFSAGLLLGAGMAMVLTPVTGKELRKDLSLQAGRLGNVVRDALPTKANADPPDTGWESNNASQA